MTHPGDRLLAAQAEAAEQRDRVTTSMRLLKAKLSPRRIAKQAMVDATIAGESAAIAGVETARRYPGTLTGLVAAAGLFLARHRIALLFRRTPRGDHETDAGDLS
ncbi:phosphatase [Sphingomonas oligophenolica]|uniref:Phosphatase n=1 Tax=Sphingomonas oligophenolica TaxID=301154 RepID=A0A502CI89_9SPHN|nr:phosphatase [Sphingomonas oligophenolica]TPG12314.1 phosphatase [Sphingomonas oligophenolica]